MNRYTFERAIKARLLQQDCEYQDAGSTPVSMLFTHKIKQFSFFIPRPTESVGWTIAQLNFIEIELAAWGLDFLPLDYNFG